MPAPRRLSTHRLAALAAAAATVFSLAGVTASADAAPARSGKLRIVSPAAGSTVTGGVRLTAAVPRSATRVSFRIDAGRNRIAKRRSRTRRDGGVVDTTPLRAGRHTVTVRARVRGKLSVKRVRFNVSKRRTLRATTSGKGRPKTGKTQTALVPVPTAPEPTEPTSATAPPAAGDVLFADTFEGGDFSAWDAVQRVASSRLQTVPAFAGRSGNVARFEVRNGDHVNGEQDSRSELAWGGDLFSEGETHTFSWSMYYAPDFDDEGNWTTQAQFKGEGTGGPPLEIATENNEFLLRGDERVNWAQLFNVPLVRGQWLDITIRVHFSADPAKGNVEMWYRGQKVVDNYKMPTLKPDRKSYFKLGLYRDTDIVKTGVVYHDDLRITRG